MPKKQAIKQLFSKFFSFEINGLQIKAENKSTFMQILVAIISTLSREIPSKRDTHNQHLNAL
ncbi:TPA: hypothetical protein ACPJNL_000078 [Haemophilus influenzae]|nr:hypothetical protein [Haemophilus influenzae]